MVTAEVKGMVEASEARGLVSRTEALRFLSARQIKTRLETRAWVRVFPTVYRVVAAPVTWRQSVEALARWGGRGAVLSHRTAAALHGFTGFSEGPLELTMTRRTRVPKGVKVFRVDALARGDVTELEDLKITSVPRTLIDLTATTGRMTLRGVVDQMLREKKTTLEKLGEAAEERSENRRGIIEFREILREFEGAGGPTESELEVEALELIAASGLPPPKVQWRIIAGRKQRRLDLSWPGVVIETDGYAWHSGIDTFEDDRERNNSLTVRNLRVLHWTWQAIQDRPDELIAELYVVLNLPR
jgi:hypothetical protein